MRIVNEPLRYIEPASGMRLTNGDVIAENEVYLAINDSPNNWYEITNEEAAEIEKNKYDEIEKY